jgi:DNA (cytosine-5)-methyltransferase 1
MRALDLFCGAGGATKGLRQAGFRVTGVDLEPQPRYCGDEFWEMDALALDPIDLWNFDFIWASPPCQAHTALKAMHNAQPHLNLIPGTRRLLRASGRPYVIENVVGAPLLEPFSLRGDMFGLGVPGLCKLLRERIFEASFPVPVPPRVPSDLPVIGIYGGHYRNRKRSAGKNREAKDFTAQDGREAMQIDWMTGEELSQAIPPAYSHYIACHWLALECEVYAAAS